MNTSKRKTKKKSLLRRIFHKRSLIVMSDESVDHFPIDGKIQFIALTLLVGGISWLSYSTGSYMTAQQSLQEKDKQLVTSVQQTQLLGEEYSLLKHDLNKLKAAEGELSEYAQFVLDQHSSESRRLPVGVHGPERPVNSAKLGEMKSRLLDRINFLEDAVAQLQDENELIVTEVIERTNNKIKEFRDIIGRTGLQTSSLAKKAKRKIARTKSKNSSHQGGPFLPENVQDLAPNLASKIDELMVLQHVVERLPLGQPVSNARLTSRFGHRYDPFNNRRAMHSGLDFVGASRAKIIAPANGVVKVAERRGAYGNYIEIDHGLGVTTRYGHLSRISVKPGQWVSKGQKLGNQGTTGRSTGEHLHYEVRYNGVAINPMKFVKAGKHVH